MDLIHPASTLDVQEALRAASADGSRILPVGGRTQMWHTGDADAELWTTQLDELVAYDPAEMIAVVGAGMRLGALRQALAGGGQEWPVDASDEATVGGVIAAGASSARRLRTGLLRDSVVEIALVTGDGRLVRSGARTVKSVQGFDIHRLATGSRGSLGVIVQAALKVRPLPHVRRTLVFEGDGMALGERLLDAVPLPTAVLTEPGRAHLRLEGWAEEVEEQTQAARSASTTFEVRDDDAFPPTWPDAPNVLEASVVPSRLGRMVAGFDRWQALLGVGLAWIGVDDPDADAVGAVRGRADYLGGGVTSVRGPAPGNLERPVPALEIHRRLNAAFDPAGILVSDLL